VKKSAFTMMCALAVAHAAFAQGTVNWIVISFAGFTVQTNSTQYSPLFGGGSTGFGTIGNTFNSTIVLNGYHFELLYLPGAPVSTPTTLAALNAWSDSGLSGIPTTAVNSFGRAMPVNPTTAATVPWAAGVTDNIMMACWSSNLGNTWAQALAALNTQSFPADLAYFGLSTTGYEAPALNDPGSVFIAFGPNFTGTPITSPLTQMYVVIPEPGTPTLAALGGFTLLLLRRRRK
jgi:hypothetical protein